MELIGKVALAVALLSGMSQAQFAVPFYDDSNGTSFGHYLDAVCGSGSDSNNGTSPATPWATIAHAYSVLSNDTSTLGIKYPDGIYRSALTGTTLGSNGFLSYWPMMQHTCGTPSATQVDDIFSGINGSLTGTSEGGNAIAPLWRNRGMVIANGGYAQVNNYSNNISAQGAVVSAFVSKYPLSGDTIEATPFLVTNGVLNWNGWAPYADSNIYFNMGSAGINVGQSITPLLGYWNVWGFLCGGGHQYVYLNTTQTVAGTPVSCAFSVVNQPLWMGWTGSAGMTGIISATMISPNTVSTADYGTIQTWLTGTELSRLNRVAPVVTPGTTAAPVLMWNSYRPLGVNATCAQIKTQIDNLVSGGWLAAGYTNIQGPINWATSTRSGGSLVTDASLCPLGMANLYTYAHSKGFTVTHYLTPSACPGVTIPNSVGSETTDAAQAASFGADRISYDSCGTPTVANWQAMSTAMIASGRSMQLNVSVPGSGGTYVIQDVGWCPAVGANDLAATQDPSNPISVWSDVTSVISNLQSFGDMVWGQEKPYCWPWLEQFAGVGSLTDNEGETFTALDSMFRSMLVLSLDATSASANTKVTTQNKEVIDLNNDVAGNGYGWYADFRTCGSTNCYIFVRQMTGAVGNAAWMVSVVNMDSSSHSVTINLAADTSLQFMWGSYYWRNLWDNWPSSCSTVTGGYSCGVNLDVSPTTTKTVTIPSHYTQEWIICNSQCTTP